MCTAIAGCGLFTAVACGGTAPNPTAPSAIMSFSIETGGVPTILTVGDSLQLSAGGLDTRGSAVTLTNFAVWQSSNSAILSVTPGGLVTAAAPGTAEAHATYREFSATKSFTIRAHNALERLDVNFCCPGFPLTTEVTLIPGNDASAYAYAVFTDGTRQEIGGYFASWTSSDQQVATVSRFGRITSLSAGTAIIEATYQGKSGAVRVNIVPVGNGQDALRALGNSISARTPGGVGTFTEDYSYNLVSTAMGAIELLLTDPAGNNLGSDPVVSVTISVGAGRATLSDTFRLRPGSTSVCRETRLVPARNLANAISTGRICFP